MQPRLMSNDLFSPSCDLPEVILAPRTDPIYNAHGYLTKVPVGAIIPYLHAFTAPGEVVVDMFAGSGMTAVAAKISGRNATVSDISVLGHHIGTGYLTEVIPSALRENASSVVQKAKRRFGNLYSTVREEDGQRVEIVRTIWSFVYECPSCNQEINYFRAMKASNWHAPKTCPHCHEAFSKRAAKYLKDEPVIAVVDGINGKQAEQEINEIDIKNIVSATESPDQISVPTRRIDEDREMYRRSALKKWGLESTRDFFSARNALALSYLCSAIDEIQSEAIQRKLRFAFTAILPRASRRYQWSPQRPLNAANQTYYIAPVYYEWNVFELFLRKVEAALRADDEIRIRSESTRARKEKVKQDYIISSATCLAHISDSSVDYVFTDPPFGSNLFYSDMSLFQEAWLGQVTDESNEAVIHTTKTKSEGSSSRYEILLKKACQEAFRILKPGRCISIVFGNSSGKIWSMVQRILKDSGFELKPIHIGVLDKGQRSVKGLASGVETVATLDLILTVRKPLAPTSSAIDVDHGIFGLNDVVEEILSTLDFDRHPTPSHIYLALLKRGFELGLPVDEMHLADVMAKLPDYGIGVNSKSGHLEKLTGKHSATLLAEGS